MTPADAGQSWFERGATRSFPLRFLVTAAALALWFWTQSLIGARGLPTSGIGDMVHTLTAPLNLYLHHHPVVADALLVVSSAIIDLLGIFLLALWIFRRTAPFSWDL
jgi:hypothetical protein